MSKAQIIIATDFSKSSDLAIEVGIEWAKVMDCHATVMHIHNTKVRSEKVGQILNDETDIEDFSEALNDKLEQELQDSISKWSESIIDIEGLLIFGDKLKTFVELANKDKCKLLVVSLNSAEGDSYVLGSVAERLVRISPVPVLIVRDDRAACPKSIAFPFAFERLSEDASYWAGMVASYFNGKIAPIHIIEYDDQIDITNILEFKEYLIKNKPNLLKLESFNVILERLEELSRLGKSNQDVVVRSTQGKKSKTVLLDAIVEQNADLIVMGSNKRSGLERLYLSSFSEFILKSSPSSILITKAL